MKMNETNKAAICILVFLCAWTVFASEQHVCNPIINVQTSANQSDNSVKVVTELQAEHVKQIIKNATSSLLDEYDKRMKNIIETLNTAVKPRDCQDVRDLGYKETGIYKIKPAGKNEVRVRCEMDEATGAWTVIQRRVSNTSDFSQTWAEYMTGFGDLNENFWLGNQHIHHITTQGWYKLRIDMTNDKGESRYAEYLAFSVGDVISRFKLFVDEYSGNAGDSLMHHNGYRFSTKDVDLDAYRGNCASSYKGGWWYASCHISNLNGVYGSSKYGQGINWRTFTGYYSSLTSVTLKVQRWTQNAGSVPLSPTP